MHFFSPAAGRQSTWRLHPGDDQGVVTSDLPKSRGDSLKGGTAPVISPDTDNFGGCGTDDLLGIRSQFLNDQR